MNFTLANKRDIVGNHVHVKIVAAAQQRISEVETELDGSSLALDRLDLPSIHFERDFRQAGLAGPGDEHTLIVRALDEAGSQEVATKIWVDDM